MTPHGKIYSIVVAKQPDLQHWLILAAGFAGRSNRDDKIHLNWIDHIKTEFFFLIFIVLLFLADIGFKFFSLIPVWIRECLW